MKRSLLAATVIATTLGVAGLAQAYNPRPILPRPILPRPRLPVRPASRPVCHMTPIRTDPRPPNPVPARPR